LVDTRWQQYSTHLHTNSTQNTENGTYLTIKTLNIPNNKNLTNFGSAGRASSLPVIPWHLPLHLRNKHGKPSVRVAAVHHKQTVQYSTRTMNSTIHRRNKEVIEWCSVTEQHRITQQRKHSMLGK
jgi:hypothetical protein